MAHETARRGERRAVPFSRVLQTLPKWIESRTLLLFAAIGAGVWVFLNVGGEVAEGETEAFDRALLLGLRNPADVNDPLGSRSIEEAMRDVTAMGGYTVLTIVTIVGALAFLLHGKRRHALVLVGSVLSAQLATELAKMFYDRPRPDLVSHGSYVYSGSFPSGHSMLSATTYLTLAVLISSLEETRGTKRMVYGLALILMLSIGFSRVYLGVHWPSDVLGGWALGAAWSLMAWVVLLKLGSRITSPVD